MPDTLERHDKFDVDDRFTLPKLEDVVVNGEVQHDTIDSTNDYYDTSDHDLRAQGVSLQRRGGDGETGWQLAVPDDGGRTELHWIHSDSPPDEVTTLLTGLTLGKEVASVAKIHTVRERYRISAPQRREPCIELDDDHVRASIGEHLLAWREVKVDSGAGARTLTKRLTKRLRAAGARPSRYPSKLAHAVPAEPAAGLSTPANRALTDYLNAQLDQIAAGDIGLRRGKDPIHDTRVAIRRLRSTLRVFRKVLDQPAIADLDSELKWFAALLGDVRDCQVQHRRFGDVLDGMPVELVLGPVRSRIRNDLQAIELPARTRLSEAMDSDRYLAIMGVLRQWRAAPPVDQDIALSTLQKRARRARHKADRRLAAALETGDDEMLHRARKAAKRARYAAELCKPVDKKAKRTVKYYKNIQSLLGDHQDTVVATEALRRMAVAAGTTPDENGFTFGMLYAREQQIARQCRKDARRLR
ncbi:MAG TPA: CYTH and CHAD domain-containing protein [Mycobacterium sp.]|jgi:CHAD domain-containing protein|nr:CYTH and CHAD domain-containing protein [Mycobacterium sp.]